MPKFQPVKEDQTDQNRNNDEDQYLSENDENE